MEYTFDIVLDQIQTFTQAAVHNYTNSRIEQPYKYFLLCSSETNQYMKVLQESLKQRCYTIENTDSEVFLQNEISLESIMPEQGWHSQYNVICKVTDYLEMEKFLPKLADCFSKFYHFNGVMISKVVKLNIFLVFTMEDLDTPSTNTTCKSLAKQYSAQFHQLFHNSKLSEAELSCVFPSCNVLFVKIQRMDDISMSALASDLAYLRTVQRDSLLSAASEDYERFLENDYPWSFYSVQNSYCAERILLNALRELTKSFYPSDPDDICADTNIVDRIRVKLLNKMGLNDLSDLEHLLAECCFYVPIEITKDQWENRFGRESSESLHQELNYSPQRGLIYRLRNLFNNQHNNMDDRTEELSQPQWNTDTNKLEVAYRQYLHTVLNNDFFFSLLFSELNGMVNSDSDDSIYMRLRKNLHIIIKNVFHGENIPAIWQNTGEDFIEALTLEKVKLQCKKIQTDCIELMKKIQRQEKNWGFGMASLLPPDNFTKYLRSHFHLHAGDMEVMNRQLIVLLKQCQSDAEAINEFQKDYNTAKSGIAFHENPVNPFVQAVHIDNAPNHVNVDCDTYRLHCWHAVTLEVMKN